MSSVQLVRTIFNPTQRKAELAHDQCEGHAKRPSCNSCERTFNESTVVLINY